MPGNIVEKQTAEAQRCESMVKASINQKVKRSFFRALMSKLRIKFRFKK